MNGGYSIAAPPALYPGGLEIGGYTPSSISLDGIVREYLTNQHALCQNPVVTCPTFDLFQ